MKGKYIYGIVKSDAEKTIFQNVTGQCGEVYTVPYQDISAVVADSENIDYSALTMEATARYLLGHQQVIEEVMNFHSIIPVRLGTYAFDGKGVRKILAVGYAMFKEIFGEVEGKVEFDVAATWNDLGSVLKEIGQKEEIKRLMEELLLRPGGVSPEDQMMVGGRVKLFLDARRERLASAIEVVLSAVASRSRRHGLMDDRMILNSAFLMDKERKAGFEKRLDEINGAYDGKIDFKCVGPLPPYSFYTVRVERISSDAIERARKTLCLNGAVTEAKVKKAYRGLSLDCHPDRMQVVTDNRFSEINSAYKLLLDCIPAGHGRRQDGFGDIVIVKLRK